jgi:hypothetical protein
MALADLLFDVSTFRYPEYPGGSIQLTEVAMLNSFVRSFESLNDNARLTRDQIQERWLHALHREYRKVLSNTGHMTQDQLQQTKELLSKGIEQVRTRT